MYHSVFMPAPWLLKLYKLAVIILHFINKQIYSQQNTGHACRMYDVKCVELAKHEQISLKLYGTNGTHYDSVNTCIIGMIV